MTDLDPLLITPLASYRERVANESRDHNVILQRLVTRAPNSSCKCAEVETTLEAFVSKHGETLWRRAFVRSGPCSPRRIVHASYRLPVQGPLADTTNASHICWTAFQDNPKHQLLCILATPTLINIWDVYPSGENADTKVDGSAITLPFEASAIHSLGTNGLIIQRKESAEDHKMYDLATYRQQLYAAHESTPKVDSSMFSKDSPRYARTPGSLYQSKTGASNTTLDHVPCFFTLSSPLDDILPLALLDDDSSPLQKAMTDVYEKVIFIGNLQWTGTLSKTESRRNFDMPVCVTFHTRKKRHAIWEMKFAPASAPTPPLWKQTGRWRAIDGWNSHLGVLQQDLEDLEISAPLNGPQSTRKTKSRKEALAQALGVRKTPRKSVEETASRTTRIATQPRSMARPQANTSLTNTSLISPTSRSLHDTSMRTVDDSMEGYGNQLLKLGPFSSLHPEFGLRCIFEDNEASSSAASECFLVSNATVTGKLTLAMIVDQKEEQRTKELRLYSFHFVESQEQDDDQYDKDNYGMLQKTPLFSVSFLSSLPCVAAQPIEATPVPLSLCGQHGRSGAQRSMVADIIVLEANTNGAQLTLYRETTPLFKFQLPQMTAISGGAETGDIAGNIVDIYASVQNRFTLTSTDQHNTAFRCSLSLVVDSSEVCERAVELIENALVNSDFDKTKRNASIEAGLKFRADCVRAEQHFKASIGNENSQNNGAEPALLALKNVLIELSTVDHKESKSQASTISAPPITSSWNHLLLSDYHQTSTTYDCYGMFNATADVASRPANISSLKTQFDHIQCELLSAETQKLCKQDIARLLFDSLHMLYEDCKLARTCCREANLVEIGSILACTCKLVADIRHGSPSEATDVTCDSYLTHYAKDLGETWLTQVRNRNNLPNTKQVIFGNKSSSVDAIPCLLDYLDRVVSDRETGIFLSAMGRPEFLGAIPRTKSVCNIFRLLFHPSKREDEHVLLKKVLKALVEGGFDGPDAIRDALPPGITVPLLDVLRHSQVNSSLFNDIKLDKSILLVTGRNDVIENMRSASMHPNSATGGTSSESSTRFQDKDKDGITPLEWTSSEIFPSDNRIREVGRLLRSSKPSYLRVDRPIEVSDHDYERLKQDRLLLLCRRVLALPVGRGMFTIGNLKPMPAEQLPLPGLCLVGRVPPSNALLTLDMSASRDDPTMWPEFHNGVAAGLRLQIGTDEFTKITRTWIVYNRQTQTASQNPQNNPNTQTKFDDHAHGGLLMAMGLRGHLSALEMSDIFDYLTYGTVTTTVGILLGMAINMRGTSDMSVSKMICLHIPSLIPHHFSSIDVASSVQTAAIASAGLLYQGSSHRMMTEFLLNEIGRTPLNDVSSFDREAYCLACGIALGMVNLCQGELAEDENKSRGLADLRVEERLSSYITGTHEDVASHRPKEGLDRNFASAAGSASAEKSSCVFEGEGVNINATAPGATLALGFMYMKSGNKSVASVIDLPDTHFLLEYVRPDFLFLRVVASSLILWNDVKGTQSWIESQIPSVVSKAYRRMTNYAGGRNGEEDDDLMQTQHEDKASSGYDLNSVRQMYTHIVAGSCFALGLRFAGTGDRSVAAVIRERIEELLVLRDSSDPFARALTPGRSVLEMCLGCSATALSMVLAGSGDLETLRLLKILRWRCEKEVVYGNHMAYGSAIGLLFLGGGICTLGREPEDIAALVTAFYPRYPSTPGDNQYHLQALRHVYAIAVKKSMLSAIDIDTGERVPVLVRISFSDGTTPIKLTTPCLLHASDNNPCQLTLDSNHFYPISIPIDPKAIGKSFYVKKRAPTLSYCHRMRNFGRTQVEWRDCDQGTTRLDAPFSFDDDLVIGVFAEYFGAAILPSHGKNTTPSAWEVFYRALRECPTHNKAEIIQMCWELQSMSGAAGSLENPHRKLWDFHLIRSYYKWCRSNQRFLSSTSSPLLNSELICYLYTTLEQIIEKKMKL